jgi:predicted RNA binding protein YcfA (HicA-like mRNA interferase family)
MNSREIIRALEHDGWQLVAVKGSHHQFKHATKPGRVTVPHPVKDIPIGTLKSIERQSGVKLR